MYTQVKQFHKKFDLPEGDEDVLSGKPRAQRFRLKFLQEELDELREALADGDRVKAFDALLDLAYVTYGTALYMGVSPIQWYKGMDAVHAANMAKVRATSANQSKRRSTLDVVKPEGWEGPEAKLEEVLNG